MEKHERAGAHEALQLDTGGGDLRANKHNVVALDGALRSVELSLALLRQGPELRALADGERRFKLPAEKCPPNMRRLDRDSRSCIALVDGGSRLEMPGLPADGPRLLFSVLDRGP